jgi:hypothetical protein
VVITATVQSEEYNGIAIKGRKILGIMALYLEGKTPLDDE